MNICADLERYTYAQSDCSLNFDFRLSKLQICVSPCSLFLRLFRYHSSRRKKSLLYKLSLFCQEESALRVTLPQKEISALRTIFPIEASDRYLNEFGRAYYNHDRFCFTILSSRHRNLMICAGPSSFH